MRLSTCLLAALLLGGAPAAGAAGLDDLGAKLKSQLPESTRLALAVSEQDEIEVGRRVASNLLGVAPLVEDAELQRYVNRVGRWVASQSSRPDLPWHFGVIDSADVNAFAGPGGYVLVTRGLYARLTDEGELAGVLAHEIAHVIKRHHIELMRQGLLIQEGSKALERGLAGDHDALVKSLVGNGAEIFARRLDQEAEFEADRLGVVLAARAGYDPYGLPAVLLGLETLPRSDDRLALLFKTHPTPAQRLLHLDTAMGERLAPYAAPRAGGRLYRAR